MADLTMTPEVPDASAEIDADRPEWLDRLLPELRRALDAVGINAEIVTEPIPWTKAHRISIIARGWTHMDPLERQNLAWRIADRVLDWDDRLKISMILTITPEELGEDD